MSYSMDVRTRLYRDYFDSGSNQPRQDTEIERIAPGLAEFLDSLIGKYFPREHEARFLDLGCGRGWLIERARQAGYTQISGVDHSASQIAAAKSRGIEGVEERDMFGALAAHDTASLDAVSTLDVIEHLTREELLRLGDEIARVLTPDGRWIIHTVNAESPFFGRIRFGDLTHEQAFTRQSLAQLCQATGFQRIETFEDMPHPTRLPTKIRRAVWRIWRIGSIIRLLAEIGGDGKNAILTQNLIAVLYR